MYFDYNSCLVKQFFTIRVSSLFMTYYPEPFHNKYKSEVRQLYGLLLMYTLAMMYIYIFVYIRMGVYT